MTFAESLATIYDDCRLDSTDAAVIARIKRFYNEGHLNLLRRPDFIKLRQRTLTLTTASARAYYGFPQAFDIVNTITDSTGLIKVTPITLERMRALDPGQTVSGQPRHWVDMGFQPVAQHPVSLPIWVVSSNALDTAQSTKTRAVKANGDELPTEITTLLNGTVRQQVTSLSLNLIKSFYLTAVCLGDVSLYDAASGGNELARIPAGLTTVQYKQARLWPTPSGAYIYTIDGQMRMYTLVQPNDIPALPENFHNLIETYARRRQFDWVGDMRRYALEDRDWIEGVAALKQYLEYSPRLELRIAGGMSDVNYSNLGGWYPREFSLL